MKATMTDPAFAAGLLPCAACASPAMAIDQCGSDIEICCADLYCCWLVRADNRADAIAAWNRRATPTPADAQPGELVKRLTVELYHIPTPEDEQAAAIMDACDLLLLSVGIQPVEPSERIRAALYGSRRFQVGVSSLP